jgi:esterase/lipase superfamily enzyme
MIERTMEVRPMMWMSLAMEGNKDKTYISQIVLQKSKVDLDVFVRMAFPTRFLLGN